MPDGLPQDERVAETPDLAAALEVFTAFTELAASETDVLVLTRKAYDVMNAHFTDYDAGYFEVRDDLWKALTWTGDQTRELIDTMLAGLPLDVPSFAQALETKEPVFIDGWNPERERIENSDGYGPACIYPLVVTGEVYGIFTVGLRDGHAWRPRDRALMRALGRCLTLAADRTEQARRLREERTALEAFAVFTEQVGSETDELTLARKAALTVRDNLTHVSVAYYERDGDLWKARVWSEDVVPDVVAQLVRGVPVDAPNLAEAVECGVAVFADHFDADAHTVPAARGYGAVAFVPLFIQGEARRMFSVGTRDARAWSEREKLIIRSVGRALSLAVDRAHTTRQLDEERRTVERRNQALEAFARLSRDLVLETERYVLVRRAQEIVLSLLPPGCAQYWEPEAGLWRVRSQVGSVGNDELQALMDEGLPFDAPSLLVPFTRLEAEYQDAYAQGADTPAELIQHVNSAAVLPLLVNGEAVGVFAIGLFEHQPWSAVNKAVLETAVQNLGLALERAQGLVALTDERRKLSFANDELEAFAYSASHDLRTPVRHISGYATLVRNALAKQQSDKAQQYLNVIDGAADRMNTLIDAMLELSRTSRLPLRVGPLDLNVLVRQVREELAPDTEERNVQWRVQQLPVVRADQDTLRQVLLNLLSNAVKYTRGREPAVIEVWAQERPHDVEVFVRDNGGGFDPRYADKLFGVFQRLHRAEEFEGIGVGLANVRRIVQRHGGTVSASGAPGEGATFSFTLPKAP